MEGWVRSLRYVVRYLRTRYDTDTDGVRKTSGQEILTSLFRRDRGPSRPRVHKHARKTGTPSVHEKISDFHESHKYFQLRRLSRGFFSFSQIRGGAGTRGSPESCSRKINAEVAKYGNSF
jgi:hypothetical protein